MADERTFHLSITTPDRDFYDGDVTMVEINTTEGQMGILKNHIPITAVLSPGVCYIHEADGTIKVCAIHTGFLEVLDSMTILAEIAEWPEEIDVMRAEEAKIRAERRLAEDASEENNITRATLSLKRSAARIEAAKK